jgi:hypothetical protein
MIFLFRSGSFQEKIKLILRATRTHATNLAKYATVYKTTMLLLKHLGSNPGKEGYYDTFFAGLVGGYLVFGRRTKRGNISSISKQIVIFGMLRSSAYDFYPDSAYSLCTSVLSISTTINTATFRLSKIPRLVTKNISRRMACLCGIELGSSHVAVPMVP